MSTIANKSDISGMLGEQINVRKVRNQLVVKNQPKLKMGPPTAKQLAVQARLADAANYASKQNEIPEAKALYATGISGKKTSAYQVALNDYLHAPKVQIIETTDYKGAIGDPISIRANDDFMVTKVKVSIIDAAGAEVEKGDAVLDPLIDLWGYKATVANPQLAGTTIKVVAYDRPGNKGTGEVVLA